MKQSNLVCNDDPRNVVDKQQLEQSTLPSRPHLTVGDKDQCEKSVVFAPVRASMPDITLIPK
jgi:hypothetical protein